MAAQEFAKAAERFGDQLEQSDTLKDVGQAMDLPVSVADHVTRTPRNTVPDGQPVTDPLDSDKFLRAVFDPTNLKSPRNTDPIEIAPNRLAAARVLQYFPSRVMTFDEARASLIDKVKMQKALRLAREAASRQLAAWKAAPASAPATPVVEVSRQDPHDQTPDVLRAAMAVPAGTLPAWGSVDLGASGDAVIEVVAVKHPAVTAQQDEGSQQEYAHLWGQAEAQAYLADLKSAYKARITALGRKLIDKSDDQGAP
jgi:peptidyl-prolyl cis-trans isomerase D